MMSMDRDPLPTYTNPPVIEVVIGVQFPPQPKLTTAMLGVFWESLGDGWQAPTEGQPIPPQFETFGSPSRSSFFEFASQLAIEGPAVRLMIKNSAGDRLIQIQNGRLHLNWKRVKDSPYPRYEQLVEEFLTLLGELQAFLRSHDIPAISPNQWEITYVNYAPPESVWGTPGEWEFFRPLRAVHGIPELTSVDSFSGEWHFEIVPQAGRLHVSFRHGTILEPVPGIAVILSLTARGPLVATDQAVIRQGLDRGHESIVRTFRELSSDEANHYWGLK